MLQTKELEKITLKITPGSRFRGCYWPEGWRVFHSILLVFGRDDYGKRQSRQGWSEQRRNPRRALHNTYFMRDTARESTGDKNKRRRRTPRQGVGALDSLPENRVHRLRVVISLYGNRGTRRARGNFIGQTRPFTIFPSGKGMAPMQIGYYPLTREREKRTRPLFPIRHVSRSMRDRASEEGRASDFSTSRKPEATRNARNHEERGDGEWFSSSFHRGTLEAEPRRRRSRGHKREGRKEDLSPFDF